MGLFKSKTKQYKSSEQKYPEYLSAMHRPLARYFEKGWPDVFEMPTASELAVEARRMLPEVRAGMEAAGEEYRRALSGLLPQIDTPYEKNIEELQKLHERILETGITRGRSKLAAAGVLPGAGLRDLMKEVYSETASRMSPLYFEALHRRIDEDFRRKQMLADLLGLSYKTRLAEAVSPIEYLAKLYPMAVAPEQAIEEVKLRTLLGLLGLQPLGTSYATVRTPGLIEQVAAPLAGAVGKQLGMKLFG